LWNQAFVCIGSVRGGESVWTTGVLTFTHTHGYGRGRFYCLNASGASKNKIYAASWILDCLDVCVL